jgi:hypothetical protein
LEYSLPNIVRGIRSRRIRWMGHVACGMHGEKRNACRVLVGKPKGKRLLERCRHKFEDNI